MSVFQGKMLNEVPFHTVMRLLKVDESEEEIVLLNELKRGAGSISISTIHLLSEYGVVGFDYGYAMASPKDPHHLGSSIR